MTTTQILQTINALSQRVEEINKKLDDVFRALHSDNAANIDYLAMMTDNDLPSEDTKTLAMEE